MGVYEMAFGLLTLDSDGNFQYSNLWLTTRFPKLLLYAGTLAVILLILAASLVTLRSWFRKSVLILSYPVIYMVLLMLRMYTKCVQLLRSFLNSEGF